MQQKFDEKNKKLAEVWEILTAKGYKHFNDLQQTDNCPFDKKFLDSVEQGRLKPSDKAIKRMKQLAESLPDRKKTS